MIKEVYIQLNIWPSGDIQVTSNDKWQFLRNAIKFVDWADKVQVSEV